MKKTLTLIALVGLVLQIVGCGAGDYEAPHGPVKPAAGDQKNAKQND